MITEQAAPTVISSVEAFGATPRGTSRAVRRRSRRTLRPGEVSLLTRYRHELGGNVLELGSRGDGLTDILAYHAYLFTGLAVSSLEVTLCRTRYENASFLDGGLACLQCFEDGAFDAIVAGPEAFERVSGEHRTKVLSQISRVLAHDGILIFSAANLEPPAREQQLEQHDFALLESVDRFDEPVISSVGDSRGDLYFVARLEAPKPLAWALVDGQVV